jgi:hypothetical protein
LPWRLQDPKQRCTAAGFRNELEELVAEAKVRKKKKKQKRSFFSGSSNEAELGLG